MKDQRQRWLGGAMLALLVTCGVVWSQSTTRRESVIWNFVNGVKVNGISILTAISGPTTGAFTFTRPDAGTVTITAADDDATAALTVAPGGAAALTLGGASATTASVITDGGTFSIDGAATLSSIGLRVTPPAAQTIAATDTITADACGTIKRVSSAGPVTTNTTNTFTAPAAGNAGCDMLVCNTGANNITLDNNANFKSIGGADVVLTADDCTRVVSDGSVWRSSGSLVAN